MTKPVFLMRNSIHRIKQWTVWLLLLVAPRRPYVVIYGYPDTEGNATEMVRATTERYTGQVFLLAQNPEIAQKVLQFASLDKPEKVTILRHRSLNGLYRFVTAEVTMFTHGVYGTPQRVPRKVLVNLWHGGGFKAGLMADHRGRPVVHSDYLVSATRRQGLILAGNCHLPEGNLLLTGNPRVDQFGHLDLVRVAELGINPDHPFVLWMPTFRRSIYARSNIQTGPGAYETAQTVNAFAQTVVRELSKAGIQTVVKPHPSDAESHEIDGAIIVSNETLLRSGILLYHLLGASSGLLTDYSSVWIDFLLLDRPIAFLVPDEDIYADQRGFDPPDVLDWLPGPRIKHASDIKFFAEDVKAKGALTAPRRQEVADHIELATTTPPVAGQIFEQLVSRGVFRAEQGHFAQCACSVS